MERIEGIRKGFVPGDMVVYVVTDDRGSSLIRATYEGPVPGSEGAPMARLSRIGEEVVLPEASLRMYCPVPRVRALWSEEEVAAIVAEEAGQASKEI